MRVAVCLHGLARGSSTPAAGGYEEKFRTLLDLIGDSDTFIHCWDTDLEHSLIADFKPKSSIFEKQKNFQNELSHFSRYNIFSQVWKNSPSQGDIFKTLSFLYSRKKSIDLKKQYEIDNRFKYDCVLTVRFDAFHHNNGKNATSHVDFDPTRDMKYLYQAYWNQTDAGASDHWFYSNSETMDKVADLYDNLEDYLNPTSEYASWCKNGFPLTDLNDELSNQVLKPEKDRAKDLKKFTFNDIILINNHVLYKYHFIKNDLWEDKSIFLNKHLFKNLHTT